MSRRAAIIGGGLGGLAAGLRLAHKGWDVTLCEAGPTFGGKMNRWTCQGYVFDTGPSLITMPWVFEDLFRTAGSSLEDHVTLLPLDPLAEYVFADGTRFAYSSSLPRWLETLKRIAPEDQDGFFRFLELGARLYEVSRQTFLKRTPYDRPGAGDWRVVRHMPLRYGWGKYDRTVRAFFKNPYFRQMFNRYPTYVGSSPYSAPATLAVIPFIECIFGGYAVKGGLYTIVEALVALACAARIDLRANAPVCRVLSDGKRATGIELESGERVASDIVLMNGDADTLPQLLGRPAPQQPRGRSLSGFVMLLGVDCDLPQLEQHTICFSRDYHREFAQLFEERRFPDDPTVYVNAPSRGDRSLVPNGRGETLFIMANAPAGADVSQASERVFARLRMAGFPDLSQHVVTRNTWTPQRMEERYRMPGGAIYGSDSHGWRNAFLRPPNRSRELNGLYCVGGSTHPGGGTPTVLLSSEITCRLIERYER